MLYHHDKRNYDEAASDAATRARAKMELLIEQGRANALEVIAQVETDIPQDQIVGGRGLDFVPTDHGVEVSVARQGERKIHRHAMGQFAQRGSLPNAYVRHLEAQNSPWATELLADNLNRLYSNGPAAAKNYLTRTVNGELRGFLSDRYKRIDSRPILESFCTAAHNVGAVPVEGYALDTKFALKALLPRVFEPVPNEVMCFGVVIENSDFGDGAMSIRGFMMRLWCTNYAISDQALRQVHIGGRMSADFALSNRTHDLQTKASVSAIRDLVEGDQGILSPSRVEQSCSLIKQAHEKEVSPTEVASYLRKALNKGEADSVKEAFNSADVVNMPAGQTRWRLSNAISWVAGNTEDKSRALEMMKLAHQAAA